ncbi:hypothetical protein D9758_005206 [Tetrapyrgos nigripes]|uniref:Uncharacterized protein n=1 Tax=Tetrapyrgos nigripes TaxID=182062 RepID=A0A8H5LX48_9AGAR|nr:hypothetical protein D9758_005206 [Tetrapyrgos nigripes]
MTSALTGHLKCHFLAHCPMYEVLHQRQEPPTQEEKDIASNKISLDSDAAKDYLKKLDTISNNIQSMFEKQLTVKQEPWDQAKFEELLAKWMAACDQLFTAVKDPEFQELLQYTHHGHSVIEQYRAHFSEVESQFVISLDAWTSSNGYAFMAIIAHYIDNKGKLIELLIDFRELIGEHSGENVADAVWDTLEKFGITAWVVAFVMDNKTNNDTLVEYFGQKCTEQVLKLLEAIGAVSKASSQEAYQDSATACVEREFDDEAMLFEDGEDDLRKIVRHVRSSPQHRKAWLKEVEISLSSGTSNKQETALMLILDVRMCWSSTHQMLRRALQYKSMINSYCARDKELRKFELEDSEWNSLKLASDWLKIFCAATTEMSTTKRPMLSKTLATLHGLQDNLRTVLLQLPHSADPALCWGLMEAHSKLSDYYFKFDQSPYYTWTALLNPCISSEGLASDYRRKPDLLMDIEVAKVQFEHHFLTKYQQSETLDSTTSPAVSVHIPSIDDSPVKFDFLSRYAQPSSSPSSLQDELDEYFQITSSCAKNGGMLSESNSLICTTLLMMSCVFPAPL